jgi:hypothetical protein
MLCYATLCGGPELPVLKVRETRTCVPARHTPQLIKNVSTSVRPERTFNTGGVEPPHSIAKYSTALQSTSSQHTQKLSTSQHKRL